MISYKLPDSVKIVLNRLESNGFEAFVVGGYVRDLLLGRETHDCDVTTNARPHEIEKVFMEYKQSHIGKDHGTVGVKLDGEWIEITTYRVDEASLDHRRPKAVRFSAHLKEDVLRRDFTMNALAMDISGALIDFVGGQNDIQNAVIRCVGDPRLRFDEDALRILRALRFAAQLDFKIDEKSVNALRTHAHLLNSLAVERVFQELQLIFAAKHSSLALFYGQDILSHIIIEMDQLSAFEINMLDEFEDVRIKWVICFRSNTVEELQHRLVKLKAPKQFVHDCVQLHTCYHHRFSKDKYALKLMMHHYPNTILQLAMDMQMKLQDPMYDVEAHRILKNLIESNACVQLKDLDLDGHDLMKFQIKGKQIQILLDKALDGVMRDLVVNNKAELLAWLNLTS